MALSAHPDSKLILVSTDYLPVLEISFKKERGQKQAPSNQEVEISTLVGLKSLKALGSLS